MQEREKQKETNKWGFSTVEIMQRRIPEIKYELHVHLKNT